MSKLDLAKEQIAYLTWYHGRCRHKPHRLAPLKFPISSSASRAG